MPKPPEKIDPPPPPPLYGPPPNPFTSASTRDLGARTRLKRPQCGVLPVVVFLCSTGSAWRRGMKGAVQKSDHWELV